MFEQLLIAPKSRQEIELFIKQPAHALLVVGLPGSGKTALSLSLAAKLLAADNLDNYPYFTVVSRPEGKKDIPIEDIRNVLHSLRLKTPGTAGIRRIVFIEDANYLSTEAQNALLKALEEPAGDTAFILSVPAGRAVLPTIKSRTAQLNVLPVSLDQANDFYAGNYTPAQINSAWQLSQGRPGLMAALLDKDQEHPLKQSVEDAKELLRHSPYQRLITLDKLSKDKERLANLLEALDKVLSALQAANISKDKPAKNFLAARRLIAGAQDSLAANVSPRLLSLRLALNLKL